MNIYRTLDNLPHFKNAVVTIGSFDGVHLGHRHIIEQMQLFAKEIGGETVVLTFQPHPRIALAAQQGIHIDLKLLCEPEEKAELLKACGVNHLVFVPFTKDFSDQSPDAYIEDFLVSHFHPKIIVIGYDHRFGKGRVGDIEYLKKFQEKYEYQVIEISKQEVDDIAVSSTKIRQALEKGDVGHAARLLGHPYVLSGTVVKGQQIGRTIGFPTANIQINDSYKLIPPAGIYSVMVTALEQQFKGMLYIGTRPTLDEGLEKTIEVHIFDFQQSIYEDIISVQFVDFLREDAKFDNLEALKIQLERDREAALKSLEQCTLSF